MSLPHQLSSAVSQHLYLLFFTCDSVTLSSLLFLSLFFFCLSLLFLPSSTSSIFPPFHLPSPFFLLPPHISLSHSVPLYHLLGNDRGDRWRPDHLYHQSVCDCVCVCVCHLHTHTHTDGGQGSLPASLSVW